MGSIGGLLGLNGGAGGSGFAGPQNAQIVPGANAGQLQNAYGGNQNALAAQQALLAALQAQNGLGNQSQVYNQLQSVANGQGPNPAQAMLNNATGANVANQAALMAGQRGAGANVGLIARQAGQQGIQAQQGAVGQGAALQAQQSLGALGQAGNMANTQAGQQIQGTLANTQANQSEQQILQNAIANANNASVSNQNSVNAANAGLANTQMVGQQGIIGGALSGAGAALAKADGGMIPSKYADGGTAGPQSTFGQFMAGMGAGMSPDTSTNPLQNGMSDFMAGAKKYALNAMADAAGMSRGGNVGSKLQAGGNVPGKAQVPGNSYQNDKVKALLSPGELVVDRETMADDGAAGQAARFLAAVIASKKKGRA